MIGGCTFGGSTGLLSAPGKLSVSQPWHGAMADGSGCPHNQVISWRYTQVTLW